MPTAPTKFISSLYNQEDIHEIEKAKSAGIYAAAKRIVIVWQTATRHSPSGLLRVMV